MVVLTEPTEAYRTVADEISEARNERVVTDVDEVTDTDDPVIYVGDASELRESRLRRLQRRLLASDGDRRFGVITGYTAADALALYEAGAESSATGEHVVAFRSGPDELPDDSGQRLLSGDRLTADDLATAADGVESLSIQTGGRTMHLFLDEGYVCGVPESRPLDGDGLPYCVADGEMDCPLSGEIVRAEQLTAEHVFVSSCASMIDNSSTGRPVHVGLGLLSGARSVVGSYRVGPSLAQEALLHYSLVRDGYDLAERCYLLNRNSHAIDMQAYPYVPFGRPKAAAASASAGEYEVDVETDAEAVTLAVRDANAHVVDVALPAGALPSAGRYYVRNVTSGYDGPPLYFTAFEEADSLRVIAYAGQRLNRDRLDLRVTARPTSADRRKRLRDALRTAADHRRFGIYDGRLAEQVTDLETRVCRLADDLRAERSNAAYHRRADETLSAAIDHLETVRDGLLDAATDVHFLTSLYGSQASDHETFPTDATCAYCDSPLFVKQVADFARTTGRRIGECPHCGPIFDVPAEDIDGGPGRPPAGTTSNVDVRECPSYPRIQVEQVADDRRVVTVEFENDQAVPVRATVVPSLVSTNPEAEQPLFQPERKERSVASGECATFEFVLLTDSLRASEYSLRAVLVGNLRLYESRRSIRVGSVTGQIPFFRT